ncbi:MAG: ABC transporter permease, partial [Mycobacterium leprae]
VFGYAATFDIKHIPMGLMTESTSPLAEQLLNALKADSTIALQTPVHSRTELTDQMQKGDLQLALVIPPDFGLDPGPGKEPAQVQVLVDGSDFFSAQAGLRALSPALQKVAGELAAEQARLAQEKVGATLSSQGAAISKLQEQVAAQAATIAELQARLAGKKPPAPATNPTGAAGSTPPGNTTGAAGSGLLSTGVPPVAVPKVEILYNPDLRSANVMIPGLTGMVILFITTLMTALGIVREKEQGTLEQIVVSPITPLELILGKLVPYTVIGLVDFALVVFAGIYLFHIPFAGSLPVFAGLAALFLLSTLGLGLLVSTMAQNQQQAIQMAMFMVFPQFLLSGFVFPLNAMPVAIRYISYLFPLTYFMPIARGMFLKGSTIGLLYRPAILMGVYGVAVILFAAARFRKRLG